MRPPPLTPKNVHVSAPPRSAWVSFTHAANLSSRGRSHMHLCAGGCSRMRTAPPLAPGRWFTMSPAPISTEECSRKRPNPPHGSGVEGGCSCMRTAPLGAGEFHTCVLPTLSSKGSAHMQTAPPRPPPPRWVSSMRLGQCLRVVPGQLFLGGFVCLRPINLCSGGGHPCAAPPLSKGVVMPLLNVTFH